MRKSKTVLTVTTLVLFIFFYSCSQVTGVKEAAVSAQTPESQVEHGKYLVSSMGCNDCHSPKVMTPQGPVPDSTRLLSGHPADEMVLGSIHNGPQSTKGNICFAAECKPRATKRSATDIDPGGRE